ncbi:MAG: gliding motility protein GldM [Cytophagaceae bacterium]|jgi:gliding motility-associated protein GldM|nr:gliding motility protein GldM [Cytophagaceae bacterium]
MATGKETPRQRMIGMMYLVLTALLALQVSSAIIEKFIALNSSMELAVVHSSAQNRIQYETLKQAVKDRNSPPKERRLVQQSEALQQRTETLIAYMNKLKQEMIDVSGGKDEEGTLKGAKEETAIEVLMLGATSKSGKAYELQKRLQEYTSFVQSISGQSIPELALDGKDDPLYRNNPEQKSKDFAQLNFAQTPLVAAMAVISELETRVVTIERDAVNKMLAQVGINDYKVDRLKPMVRSMSKYVPAGTPFQAEVFMAATSTSMLPQISVGNQALNVNGDGIGQFRFTASGGNYDTQGLLKKSFTAQIKVKKPNGQDTVYTVTEEYYVVQPVIKAQTVSGQSLYFNCGNKKEVDVPALGAYYKPSFTATGATVQTTDKKGVIYIIPTKSRVELKVYSDGQFIGLEPFKVNPVPKPTIEVRVNGAIINAKTGVTAQSIRNISIKAIPESNFARELPEDAVYKVVEWSIEVGRGKNSVIAANMPSIRDKEIVAYNGNNVQSRDVLFVTPKKVLRKTYLGTWEEVSLPSTPIVIPVI